MGVFFGEPDAGGRGDRGHSMTSLSIIVPAYNEAHRIEPTLDSLGSFAATRAETTEIIVVDDGSTDETIAIAEASRCPNLRVISSERNRGKGHAVRVGMLAASGERRLFMDADSSTTIAEFERLDAELDRVGGSGVVFASIAVPGAQVIRPQSGIRPAAGRMGNRLIQAIALPGVSDSQRGFKLFSRDAAVAVFSRCVVNGWGFDVEALAIARRFGFDLVEVPITWAHMEESRVTAFSYVVTLTEVLGVRFRLARGAYDRGGAEFEPAL